MQQKLQSIIVTQLELSNKSIKYRCVSLVFDPHRKPNTQSLKPVNFSKGGVKNDKIYKEVQLIAEEIRFVFLEWEPEICNLRKVLELSGFLSTLRMVKKNG